MEADECCPLCMEDMDVTDKNFRPCKCGYQICLFCYRHIKDDLNGLCPACRTPYDEANVTFVTPDPQEMAKLAKEKKAKELKDKKEQQAKEKRDAELKARQEAQARAAASVAAAVSYPVPGGPPAPAPRPSFSAGASVAAPIASSMVGRQPAGQAVSKPATVRPELREVGPMRVIQRTLVYVMGLSPRIAKEEILRRHEYFGQYGKILRIQVNGAHLHHAANGPPSCSCYITYSNREEAEQAILAVDNVVLDGRALKASFGTTKSPHLVAQELSSVHDLPAEREESQPRDDLTPPGRRVSDPVRGTAVRSGNVQPDRSIHDHENGWDPSSGAQSAPIAPPSSMHEPIARHSVDPPPPVAPPPQIAAVKQGGAAPGPHISPIAPPASVSELLEPAEVASKLAAKVEMRPDALGASPVFGAACDPMIGSCPTGSEAEPWSMLGSFEDLLSGIVADEGEDEEEELPCSSRFARFFTKTDKAAPSEADPPGSALSSLGGVKMEQPEPQDNWQQGFRALLPNVNISFSAFSDGGAPIAPGSHGVEAPAPSSAPLGLASVGGFGGLGFGGFGSQGSKFASSGNGLGSGAGTNHFSDGSSAVGNGGGSSFGGDVFGLRPSSDHQLGNSFHPGLGSAALNSGSSLAASGKSEVSLLGQLSGVGPLPGAQLPNSQLSSQLQSLLQGANATSSAGALQASGRAVGGALLPSSQAGQAVLASASAPGNGLWSGNGASGLMPGWLPSEGLLPLKADDQGSADGSQSRDQSGGKALKKDVGMTSASATDRGSKAKKRGGTSNRGKGDPKTAHK